MVLTFLGKVRSGKREWIFQRASNIVIGLWGAVFIAQILSMTQADYAQWQAIFEPLWFKLYTSITLLMICLNSVLAGWQIGTDYVKKESANQIFMTVCTIGSAIYALIGLYILWL